MSVISWLFWPSLIVLIYAIPAWLFDTFWDEGLRAVVALGDMAPRTPVRTPLAAVDIRVVYHELQRYETIGDYVMHDDKLVVRVSQMADPRHCFLVALHELVEATLLRHRGISFAAVDEFDLAFERERAAGNTDEPGDDPRAPYHREHQFATFIERAMAEELGVDWKIYTTACNTLTQ